MTVSVRRPNLAIAIGVGLMVSFWLYTARIPSISSEGALLSLTVIWAGLFPSFVYFSRAQPRAMPVMPLCGIFYAVAFGLPTFLIPLAWPHGIPFIHWPSIVPAVVRTEPIQSFQLAAAGTSLLVAAFLFCRYWLFSRVPYVKIGNDSKHTAVLVLAWILLFAHFAHAVVPWIGNLPSIGQFLGPAGMASFGIFLVYFLRRRLSPLHATFVLTALLLEITLRVQQLLITPTILLGAFLAIILLRERLKSGVFLLAAAIIPLILVYPVWTANKNGIVNYVSGQEAIISYQGYSANLADTPPLQAIAKTIDVYRSAGMTAYLHPIIKRISRIWVLDHVTALTPASVPYWRGETYKPLMGAMVPRVFWPDKPTESTGYKFGVRYHLVRAEDTHMSFNLPWLVEFFVNFGTTGVLVGMGLVGIVLGLLDKLFNDPKMSDLEIVCGLAIIFPLFYQESNLSVMVGSLPLFAISLYLYFIVGLKLIDKIRQTYHPGP